MQVVSRSLNPYNMIDSGMNEKKNLSITVDNIVYSHSNGFTVVRGTRSDDTDLVTAVGEMPPIEEGQNLDLTGHWTVHEKYGKQFQVEECEINLPTTENGIQNYLASDMVSGIGPKIAERITDEFGEETLKTIDENPKDLKKVKGIGEERLKEIEEGWGEQRKIRSVMLALKRYDISTNYALKLYREYGNRAPSIVEEEPYRLTREIEGIGFKRADQIARSAGLDADDPGRIGAGIEYALKDATEEGHLYLPKDELLRRTKELLSLDRGKIENRLGELKDEQQVIEQGPIGNFNPKNGSNYPVYLTAYFNAESGLAQKLAEKVREKPSDSKLPSEEKIKKAVSQFGRAGDIDFNEEQLEAIETSLSNKATVITGGPGTGKTTTIRGIIRAFERLNDDVHLTAPTGRAAKRLSSTTGREAKTIHRLLGYKPPDQFRHHEGNELDTDAVIIDEMSMVDLLLMDSLIRAIPKDANIVMVGDVDQLPPVGPGDVLEELISSGKIPVIELSEIHRQARQSEIVANAHRINSGDFPAIEGGKTGDFWFFREENPERAARRVVKLAAEEVGESKDLDPFSEIQVLAPMHKGICGVDNLNTLLQEELNPNSGRKVNGKYAAGDKVMQVENDYERDVFNGDIGRVSFGDSENDSLRVEFPGRGTLEYSEGDINKLVLAYAITIHKSQGSEYEAVIIPLLSQHYIMLKRNLLYTAITRSKQLVAVVGTQKSLAMAINNDEQKLRHSLLGERLRSNFTR